MRLLLRHPHVQLEYIGSRSQAGVHVSEVLPSLPAQCDFVFEAPDAERMAERCDVIFTATPRGAGMPYAEAVAKAGKRLIDIGTDFRFRDPAVYEAWYEVEHTCPQLSIDAAYGLPELFRSHIEKAHIVGNPGCYPTSVLLGVAPAVANNLVDVRRINIVSYTGISGAGATPTSLTHLPEAEENLQPYGVASHRHTPEIEQGIRLLQGKEAHTDDFAISFTPHLAPLSRGILSTLVLEPKTRVTQSVVQEAYETYYENEMFVRVLTQRFPSTKPLRGTNMCDISVQYDERAERVIVMAAIDNLVKGASGQAVQNMNILFDLPEHTALTMAGMYP